MPCLALFGGGFILSTRLRNSTKLQQFELAQISSAVQPTPNTTQQQVSRSCADLEPQLRLSLTAFYRSSDPQGLAHSIPTTDRAESRSVNSSSSAQGCNSGLILFCNHENLHKIVPLVCMGMGSSSLHSPHFSRTSVRSCLSTPRGHGPYTDRQQM